MLSAVLVTNQEWDLGRLAVFECEEKQPKSWRMALLERKECSSRQEMTIAFGYYLTGIKFLADAAAGQETESNLLNVSEEKCDYLGPNCSRITLRDA